MGLVLTQPAFSQFEYTLQPKKDRAIIGTSLGLGIGSAIFYLTDKPVTADRVEALNPMGINPLDRSATKNWSPQLSEISDFGLIVGVVTPTLLLLSDNVRGNSPVFSAMYAETLISTIAVMGFVKNTTLRMRPYAYNPNVPMSKRVSSSAQRSFFSGHTALAFSSAVFTSTLFSHYHPNSSLKPWVWSSAMAFASGVGYLRYASGKHFPTDIIAGAIVGTTIGYLVPKLHEQRPKKSANAIILSVRLF